MYKLKPAHSLPALVVLTLSMMAACFWPFKFHPHNDVMFLPGEQALRFNGLGTAYSRNSFPSLRELSVNNELTVELAVRPKRVFTYGLPNILSFSDEKGQPTLVIGAWKKSLVVRLGRPGNHGWEKHHEIGIDDIFVAGKTVHLVVSLSPRGTDIFVDGRFKQSFPAAAFDTSNVPLGRLLLGNSPTGDSLWRGDMLALAFYDRALTPVEMEKGAAAGALPRSMESDRSVIARYRFDKMQSDLIPYTSDTRYAIVIPTDFSPLHLTVLEPLRRGRLLTLSFISDFVLNVLGFVPFGCLAMFYLGTATDISPRWQSTIVVLAGFSLSLGIELVQVYLPTRSSTLIDLATNTLGSATGVLLSFILTHWKLEVSDEEVATF